MRIIIASQTYSPGNGQASFTIQLAENMAKHGHQVMVIAPSENMHAYGTYKNDVRIEKVPAVHLSLLHPAMYITPMPAPYVKKLFNAFQPDVVHIQDHYFLCSAIVNEAHQRAIPLIGTNHFLPENILPLLKNLPRLQHLFAIPLWQMMLSVFNKLDVATTPSKTAARILRAQKIRIPVHAISNGVDINRFKPDPVVDHIGIRRKYELDTDKFIFLYVGRLDGEKRLDILLSAIALLPRNDIQLALCGQGFAEQALRKQVQAQGQEGRVKFIGFAKPEDLSAIYNSADVFVMPSPEELQSIATLEAMACGKPILAANARALPELVQTDINGYLFEPNNPADAAQGIEYLLSVSDKWQEMGKASFKQAQLHSAQNSIKQYEEHYKTITERIHIKSGQIASSQKKYAERLSGR